MFQTSENGSYYILYCTRFCARAFTPKACNHIIYYNATPIILFGRCVATVTIQVTHPIQMTQMTQVIQKSVFSITVSYAILHSEVNEQRGGYYVVVRRLLLR